MRYIKLYKEHFGLASKNHHHATRQVEEATTLSELEIGDYVICYDELFLDCTCTEEYEILMNDFLENNVGQFIDFNNQKYGYVRKYNYVVEYQNIPEKIL